MTIQKGLVLGVLAVLLLVGGVAAAPRLPSAVERSRHVLASGATSNSVNGITLRATLGQPFVSSSSNAGIVLSHGFWLGGEVGYIIYLPLMLAGYP